jgi:hyperosmotically inducible periplasmic protein
LPRECSIVFDAWNDAWMKGELMRSKLAFAGLLAGALMLPALTQAADDQDQDRSNPKAYVKDSVITTKIKAKLAAEKPTSLATIHVDTDANGVVWLSGTAKSQDQVEKAISIARATENVRDVKSSVKVKADS